MFYKVSYGNYPKKMKGFFLENILDGVLFFIVYWFPLYNGDGSSFVFFCQNFLSRWDVRGIHHLRWGGRGCAEPLAQKIAY